jgi:dTDP-4-amino-4,6-dideoxygalactose transaminase
MNQTGKIALVDLKVQYLELKAEIDKAISDCILEDSFIKGKIVSVFENAFAKYLGTEYCIGCGNGTDALELILKSLNIGQGNEVIVPALTWIATAEAVNNVGAEPVFADIDATSLTIDVHKIVEKITKKTKAIIPVHLYGNPADMNGIIQIAKNNNLYVIEDCAQAHGAEYFGKKVGTFGIAASFSFFPSKNLGAFGDAGAVVTSSEELANSVRRISNHGQLGTRHSHSIIGRNSRLDSIQAAILNVKLPYLDKWNNNRIKASDYYRSKLSGISDLTLPATRENIKHVFHLFILLGKRREELIEVLTRNGIGTGIHYPVSLPFLEAYKYKHHNTGDFPTSERVSCETLSLPIFPEITNKQIDRICESIFEVYGDK